MSKADAIRAWKDQEYRSSLANSELGALPPNPAGMIDLSEIELSAVAGGTEGVAPTGCIPTCAPLHGCPTNAGQYEYPGWAFCTLLSALALCMCFGADA
jgi:mersacidin/lichenicidin family type 2 lantibiotic